MAFFPPELALQPCQNNLRDRRQKFEIENGD